MKTRSEEMGASNKIKGISKEMYHLEIRKRQVELCFWNKLNFLF